MLDASLTRTNEMAAGAVRGITDSDDAAVEAELINRVDWIQPDDTPDEGRAMIAAHLLACGARSIQ